MELVNANKKYEQLLSNRLKKANEDEELLNKSHEQSKIEDSEEKKEILKQIKKQGNIIKTLNDTVKYYQVEVERQKNEINIIKKNCNCAIPKELLNNNIENGKELYNQHLKIVKHKVLENNNENIESNDKSITTLKTILSNKNIQIEKKKKENEIKSCNTCSETLINDINNTENENENGNLFLIIHK